MFKLTVHACLYVHTGEAKPVLWKDTMTNYETIKRHNSGSLSPSQTF